MDLDQQVGSSPSRLGYLVITTPNLIASVFSLDTAEEKKNPTYAYLTPLPVNYSVEQSDRANARE